MGHFLFRHRRETTAHVVDGLLFDKGQQTKDPTPRLHFAGTAVSISYPVRSPASTRIVTELLFMEQPPQCLLLQMTATLGKAGRLARRLNRRQQQCDENVDNGDYH